MEFPETSELSDKLEKKLYEHIEKIEPSYDKNEDIVHGVTGDIVFLPTYDVGKKSNVETISVNMSDIGEHGMIINKEVVEGICQHNVSWDEISYLSKNNPKEYTDRLYDFIQQYAWENVNQDFVCKSCGIQLNIKKYILDGAFDDESQKFVTFGTPMSIPLEDIVEYEKYKIAIRNMDKIIDKIGFVSGIPHISKMDFGVRQKRKLIIKDAIDLLLMNNDILKANIKEYNIKSQKTYGINKDLSNLFVFEFESSIFVFSSKDKDHYKPIKQNNILSYLIFLISLDINDSQLFHMGGDKKGFCNFQIFEKGFGPLFDGLKIIVNSKGDVDNINNYKILCYIIYIIGCSVIKYNMWYYDYPDSTKKKNYTTIIQKIYINTIVDIINSVLENSLKPGVDHLYEILRIKFHRRLSTIFSNEEIYQRLVSESKTSISDKKSNSNNIDSKCIKLSGKFKQMDPIVPRRFTCRPARFYGDKKVKIVKRSYHINNITNCEDGQFHEWKPVDGEYVCKLCQVKMEDNTLDKKESKNIIGNYKFVRLRSLSTKFCNEDGSLHIFIKNDKNKIICMKCKNGQHHTYSDDELLKLDKILTKVKESDAKIHKKEITQMNINSEKELSYVDKVVKKIVDDYKSNDKDNSFVFVENFINEIQNIIGSNTRQNSNVFLIDDGYIIDHDHLGNDIDKNITITNTSNKISYKRDHSFFKTDVIHYSSYKNGKIDIFYDAMTKLLLGYKEESKNYTLVNDTNKRLTIKYSTLNKLKLLGYPSQYINVKDEYDKSFLGRENIPNVDERLITKRIIMNIIRERIMNLKHTIFEFQMMTHKIINGYDNETENDQELDEDFFANKTISLMKKYNKSLAKVNISDNKKNMIFKHWKGVHRGIFSKEIDEVKYDFRKNTIINSNDISKLDENGNSILFYLIKEFKKLLDYNTDKYLKTTSAYFLLDFINLLFESFNTEQIMNNINIRRFEYILNSVTYVREIDENFGTKDTEGIYSEYVDSEEEISEEQKELEYDIKEEDDAMDVERDTTEDGFMNSYEYAVEWEPDNEIIYNPNYQ
jgi:hypothetical protein